MVATAEAVDLETIRPWRDAYRRAMSCQIIHDSIHVRPGWTHEYLLSADDRPVGYGSVAVSGPWRDETALYELFIEPRYRHRLLDLAEAVLVASRAAAIEIQTNDPIANVMLHHFGKDIRTEAILFEDAIATHYEISGAIFRHPTPSEASDLSDDERQWRGVIELEGVVAAGGGVLFHYNPPYGDVYMDVDEAYRQRGLGTLMVQELKRLCHTRGFRPAARCNPANLASRRTLQKAGFAPCGHILKGIVK